ncbi:MAG: ABC transporter ATP-binding protein [Spirochaetales bacterium]|nr:ABC transporter ATP-binding protein [Spirochaetales bacterium]
MLRVTGLCKAFGGLVAVHDIDLAVERGTIHAVIGPNGAGKTTFFNALTALIPPDSGEIVFNGRRIDGLATHRIAALGIGRTFQNIRLFPYLSVLENVKVGAHILAHHTLLDAVLRSGRFRREEREIHEFALALLDRVGLADKRDAYARNLPYGEQRKLEISRALASKPSLLLLDEPAAGMNNAETAALDEFIRSLKAEGYTILLIEHDMKLVMSIADRITVIDHGEKISEGVAREVQADERVIEAYLGRRAGAAE